MQKPIFTIRTLDYFFQSNENFTSRSIKFTASQALGDVWNSIKQPNAEDSDDLFLAITNKTWLKRNIKSKYHPALKLLELGVVTFKELQDVITTDQRMIKRVASYFNTVHKMWKNGSHSIDLHERFANSRTLELWFFGKEVGYSSFKHPENILNLQLFKQFLLAHGLIAPQQVEDLITLYYACERQVQNGYAHKFISRFVRWFTGSDDFGQMIIAYFSRKVTGSLLDAAGIYLQWMEESTGRYVIMHPDEYYYLIDRHNINYITWNFEVQGDDTYVPLTGIGTLSDYEISRNVGGVIYAKNRSNAISMYMELSRGRKYFFDAYPATFRGQESPIAYEEITDDSIIFGYGNLAEKIPYTLEDIRLSIGDEDSIPALKLGETLKNIDYKHLVGLLTKRLEVMEVFLTEHLHVDTDELIDDDEGALYLRLLGWESGALDPLDTMLYIRDKMQYLKLKVQSIIDFQISAVYLFKQLADEHREQAIALCYDIVTMGLYFRRWKGPGHPFPYKSSDTLNLKVKPEVLAHDLIVKYTNILRDTNNVTTKLLSLMPRFNSLGPPASNSFLSFFTQTIRGEECIRVASKTFIVTGYRCLIMVGSQYRVMDDTFDLRKMEDITLHAPEELVRMLQRSIEEARRTGDVQAEREATARLSLLTGQQ